jgi:hypothetical protein
MNKVTLILTIIEYKDGNMILLSKEIEKLDNYIL